MSDCKFEVGKTYQTLDGRNARVVATDFKSTTRRSIVYFIDDGDGREALAFGFSDGTWHGGGIPSEPNDLVPPTQQVAIRLQPRECYWSYCHPNVIATFDADGELVEVRMINKGGDE